MRERLKQKIRSRSGASIAIALLLFLVCAAVGAVVLTAGTAAAGHASQQEEMDRRYYSVLSAAELVRDQLDGKTYIIERIETVTDSKAGTYKDGEIQWGPSSSTTDYDDTNCKFSKDKEGKIVEDKDVDRPDSLLSEAVYQYVYGEESKYAIEGYKSNIGYDASPCNKKDNLVTMTLPPPSGSKALPVKMTVDLKPDGSLLITLVNLKEDGDPAPAGSAFKMELTMNAAFSDNSDAPSVHSSSSSKSDGDTITITTETVTTKTSKISWTAGPVRVVSAAAAEGGA